MKGVRHAVPTQADSQICHTHPTFAMVASSSSTLSLVGDRPSVAGSGGAVVDMKEYEATTQRGKNVLTNLQFPEAPGFLMQAPPSLASHLIRSLADRNGATLRSNRPEPGSVGENAGNAARCPTGLHRGSLWCVEAGGGT